MGATTILERATELGISLRVEGENIRYKPKEAAPPDFVEDLRQHKAEVIQELTAMPPVPLPPENPVAEAKRVPRIVRERGVCLLWAEAVKDYVAFALNEEEARKVPPGYVVYTLTELEALYGPGKKAPSLARLRMIHQAKKLGGRVVGDEQDKAPPCQNHEGA